MNLNRVFHYKPSILGGFPLFLGWHPPGVIFATRKWWKNWQSSHGCILRKLAGSWAETSQWCRTEAILEDGGTARGFMCVCVFFFVCVCVFFFPGWFYWFYGLRREDATPDRSCMSCFEMQMLLFLKKKEPPFPNLSSPQRNHHLTSSEQWPKPSLFAAYLRLFKVIFYFVPWYIAIKPPFKRICLAFSKHLKQIQVYRGLFYYPVICGLFHKPWIQDPYMNQSGFHGSCHSRVFFMLHHVGSCYWCSFFGASIEVASRLSDFSNGRYPNPPGLLNFGRLEILINLTYQPKKGMKSSNEEASLLSRIPAAEDIFVLKFIIWEKTLQKMWFSAPIFTAHRASFFSTPPQFYKRDVRKFTILFLP